jgi:hypothetical protein
MFRFALLIGILWSAAELGLAQSCTPDGQTLCLNGGRFEVTARFRTLNEGPADANATGLTGDSGYFWFFNSANIEVVIKVLNACGLNQNYWVFATGLTNVEVTLVVTDTQNGTQKIYVNPLQTAFAPIQDTSAFHTCP